MHISKCIMLVCLSILFFSSCGKEEIVTQAPSAEIVPEQEATDDTTGTESSEALEEELPYAEQAAQYSVYTGDLSFGTDEKILFFTSEDCGDCQIAKQNLSSEEELAVFSDVIEVDLSINTALAEEYEVESAHTFVLIDENGNLIKKISGWISSESLLVLYE